MLRRFEAKLFREDWRVGLLAAIQVNSVPRKGGARPAKPTDFIPGYVEPLRLQSKDEALLFMQAFKAAHLAKKDRESKKAKKRR